MLKEKIRPSQEIRFNGTTKFLQNMKEQEMLKE